MAKAFRVLVCGGRDCALRAAVDDAEEAVLARDARACLGACRHANTPHPPMTDSTRCHDSTETTTDG